MARLRRGSGHRSALAVPRPLDVCSGGHATALWRGLASRSLGTGSRIAFSQKILLDTTPELAANSAIPLRRAKAAGPARPNISWLSGTNRHAPVPVRLYLSRLSKPFAFPLAVVPVVPVVYRYHSDRWYCDHTTSLCAIPLYASLDLITAMAGGEFKAAWVHMYAARPQLQQNQPGRGGTQWRRGYMYTRVNVNVNVNNLLAISI